jgi:hypothetical protein
MHLHMPPLQWRKDLATGGKHRTLGSRVLTCSEQNRAPAAYLEDRPSIDQAIFHYRFKSLGRTREAAAWWRSQIGHWADAYTESIFDDLSSAPSIALCVSLILLETSYCSFLEMSREHTITTAIYSKLENFRYLR